MRGEGPVHHKPHTDVLGQEVSVGDFFVYGTSFGSHSTCLKIGRVKELRHNEAGYPWVAAVTVESNWHDEWKIQNKGRTVRVTLGAMAVIPYARIPADARELLK